MRHFVQLVWKVAHSDRTLLKCNLRLWEDIDNVCIVELIYSQRYVLIETESKIIQNIVLNLYLIHKPMAYIFLICSDLIILKEIRIFT